MITFEEISTGIRYSYETKSNKIFGFIDNQVLDSLENFLPKRKRIRELEETIEEKEREILKLHEELEDVRNSNV